MRKTIQSRAASGMFWTVFDTGINQGISFIVQIILARILLPDDFGLIGIITVFIALSASMIDCGFASALIREKETTQEDCSTMFYFNLFSSVVLYVVIFFFAPLIAQYFEEPRIVWLLRILSFTLIINSFGIIQRALLTKNINFKLQTKINAIAALFSGVAALLIAYNGFGVWALVFRLMIMQSLQSALLWRYNRWFPSMTFSKRSFHKLFGFGWKLLLSSLIETFYQNLYYMIIGKYFSVTALGYYTNAKKLNDVASQALSAAVQKVSYPVLSAMQDDRQKLRSGYRRIIRSTMFIAFPLMIGLSAVSEPFILFMFGEKWAASVPYVQLMCVEGMLYPLHSINLNILQVKGRSDLFLRLELIKKMIFTLIVAAVMYVQGGIVGLILGGAASSVISYFINAYYSAALISYSIKEQLKDISPSFFISCMMGGIAWGAGIVVDSLPLKLLLQSFLCIGSYIFFSWLFRMEEIACIRDMVRALRK